MNSKLLDEIDQLKRQLAALEERMRSSYKTETEMPLSEINEKTRLQRKISMLESELDQDNRNITSQVNSLVDELEAISRTLSQRGWQEDTIDELDQWILTLESNRDAFTLLEQTKENTAAKLQTEKAKLESLVNRIRKNKQRYDYISSYFEKHPSTGTAAFFNIMPPSLFTDRENFLESLRANFEKHHVIVVAGVSGIGKTYLVNKFVSDLKLYYAINFRCTPELTVEQFLFTLGELIASNLADFSVAEALQKGGRLTEAKIIQVLALVDRERLIIVIDDYQNANNEFESIVRFFEQYTNTLKLIVITRRRTKTLRNLFFSIYTENLSGIAKEKVSYYLSRYRLDIKEDQVDGIYQLTSGHPLALRLFASLVVNDRYDPVELVNEFKNVFGDNLKDELISRIHSELTDEENTFLMHFSVFQKSVRREAVDYIYDRKLAQTILRSLLHRFLITEPIEHEFIAHDLIRTYFYSRLEQNEKHETHMKAAQYYIDQAKDSLNVDSLLEGYHHYYLGERFDEAAKIATQIMPVLYTKGQYETVVHLVDELTLVVTNDLSHLNLYKGRVLEIWGQWDEAAAFLRPIAENEAVSSVVRLGAMSTILQIYEEKGEYAAGLELFENYHKTISQTPSAELAHFLFRAGRFYNEIGDYNKTMEWYNKSLEISTQLNDRHNIERTGKLIGVAMWFFGDYENSLSQLNKIKVMCQEDNNVRELIDTLKHIGTVYVRQHKYEQAIKEFRDSIRLCESYEYPHGLGGNLMGLAEAYIPLKRFDEAAVTIDQALLVAEKLGEMNGIVRTKHLLGYVYTGQGLHEKAVSVVLETVQLAEKLGSATALGEVLETLAYVYDVKGDKEHAQATFVRVLKLYEQISSKRVALVQEKLNQLSSGNQT